MTVPLLRFEGSDWRAYVYMQVLPHVLVECLARHQGSGLEGQHEAPCCRKREAHGASYICRAGAWTWV